MTGDDWVDWMLKTLGAKWSKGSSIMHCPGFICKRLHWTNIPYASLCFLDPQQLGLSEM
jgi:hypothetical protein